MNLTKRHSVLRCMGVGVSLETLYIARTHTLVRNHVETHIYGSRVHDTLSMYCTSLHRGSLFSCSVVQLKKTHGSKRPELFYDIYVA